MGAFMWRGLDGRTLPLQIAALSIKAEEHELQPAQSATALPPWVDGRDDKNTIFPNDR
jgi:hypothetical protein